MGTMESMGATASVESTASAAATATVATAESAATAAESAAAESALAALQQLAGGAVLVAGDAMLDRYWFGRVDRISPEAPVPVVTVQAHDARLGGAGNVAANIAALGGRATLLAVVGDDEAAEELDALAARAGITRELIVDRGGKTTVKLRAIARHQQLLRADFEAAPSAAALDAAADKFAALVGRHQAVAFSDYGKGGLARVADWIATSAAHGVPALVDPKGRDFGKYRGAALVTPNLAEFEQVAGPVAAADLEAGAAAGAADGLRAKAEKLLRDNDLQRLLVTLGERGMALFSRGGEALRRPARARAVFDVSGAGDTVMATLALAAAAGVDDEAALALANAAAGVVVSKVGTATAGVDEIRAALTAELNADARAGGAPAAPEAGA